MPSGGGTEAVAMGLYVRQVGPGELRPEGRRQAPAQHVRPGADILLVAAAIGHHRIDALAGIDIADVAGVLVERGFELEPDALEADRGAIGVLARDLLAE